MEIRHVFRNWAKTVDIFLSEKRKLKDKKKEGTENNIFFSFRIRSLFISLLKEYENNLILYVKEKKSSHIVSFDAMAHFFCKI